MRITMSKNKNPNFALYLNGKKCHIKSTADHPRAGEICEPICVEKTLMGTALKAKDEWGAEFYIFRDDILQILE